MSWTLFKADLKSTWAIVVGVTLFVMIYVAASIAMYDPTSAEKMQQMFEMLPEGFLKALGFDNLVAELTPYLSNYLYGFIMLIFPMIGSSVLANSLVAKHVDTGSMAYLLATPNTRVKVMITQAIYMLCALVVIFAVNVGVTILYRAGQWVGMLDIGLFMQLNLVTVLVAFVVSAISFLAACAFGGTKLSLSLGVGIPVAMFVLKMISEISEDLQVLRNFTIYTLVDIERIINGDTSFVIVISLVLIGATVLIYGAAITLFNKKSLVI